MIIQQVACAVCGVEDVALLHTATRKQEVVFARDFIWRYLRGRSKLSLEKLALIFGKDHATVLNGLRSINNVIDTNHKDYALRWNLFLKRLIDLEVITYVITNEIGEVISVNILRKFSQVA